MDKNVMFGELAYFTEKEYFEEHTTGTLYLPDNTYSIEFFSCLQTDAYDTEIFNPGDFSETQMEVLLEHIYEDSIQYREIDVSSQDKILALSTCSDASTNARTIVVGRIAGFSQNEGGDGGE